jgi:hypothetical protein
MCMYIYLEYRILCERWTLLLCTPVKSISSSLPSGRDIIRVRITNTENGWKTKFYCTHPATGNIWTPVRPGRPYCTRAYGIEGFCVRPSRRFTFGAKSPVQLDVKNEQINTAKDPSLRPPPHHSESHRSMRVSPEHR